MNIEHLAIAPFSKRLKYLQQRLIGIQQRRAVIQHHDDTNRLRDAENVLRISEFLDFCANGEPLRLPAPLGGSQVPTPFNLIFPASGDLARPSAPLAILA
jgi:hypothetical protein